MSACALPEPAMGRIEHGVSLARYSTWRVGGPAATLFFPDSLSDLAGFIASQPATTPVHCIGLGSNLLVRDGGVDGVVIRLAPGLGRIDDLGDGHMLVEAGVAAPKLARHAVRAGYGGAEFLAGIPGSVGGALAMNAGCFGSSTWEHVLSVTVLDAAGGFHELPPSAFTIGYRQVRPRAPGQLHFIAASFAFDPTAGAPAQDRLDDIIARRAATQPIGTANAGSVFTNPPDDSAGRLIEAAGLAGHRVGAAVVSPKHCNFIINEGGATAADIEELIAQVQATVSARHGVELHPEVRIIGTRA